MSDPNAATDGSTVVNGAWAIKGSAAAVATALDGLVFTPADHEVAPGSTVTTTVTASIKDTAGQTTSTKSTITATALAVPIAVTPASHTVATTDTTKVTPFTAVAITDANAGQTETATVTLSFAANGTLSDPNAATDGSTIASGAWTIKGSAATVATTLDGLVFEPTVNQVAAGASVATTLTAAIKDTAGEAATITSTITATQVAVPPTVDTLALQISEDAWAGDAEFTVKVNGQQVGGVMSASTLHSSGDSGTFLLTGTWNSGVNDVQLSFINDANGGTSSTDRNLYVNSIAYNGATYSGTSAALTGNSTDTFLVGGTTPTATASADKLTLILSEDAFNGNSNFILYIDGKAVTTAQPVTAFHSANATQSFNFAGDFGAGSHTIGIAFTNDEYGGSSSQDRNLYIDGISLNGTSISSSVTPLYGNGTVSFGVTTTH